LIDVEAGLTLARVEVENGKEVRKFDTLPLEYTRVNFLSMTWTIVHPIDDLSPLAKMKEEDYATKKVEILLSMKAFDETFSQTIHTRSSYKYDELVYGAKFKPVTDPGPNGSVLVALNRIGDYDQVKI
jgi:inward rectifier potassium channel